MPLLYTRNKLQGNGMRGIWLKTGVRDHSLATDFDKFLHHSTKFDKSRQNHKNFLPPGTVVPRQEQHFRICCRQERGGENGREI